MTTLERDMYFRVLQAEVSNQAVVRCHTLSQLDAEMAAEAVLFLDW